MALCQSSVQLLYIKAGDGEQQTTDKEEWAEYWATVDKQERREYLRLRTYTVLFKVLCPNCAHNAEVGKKIIYDCPHCRIIKWHNCSIKQVISNELKNKILTKYPTTEWIKAYDHSRAEKWSWKKHEPKFKQDIMGHWVPK